MEKKAKKFFESAKSAIVKVTDQNDDGKFDKEDVSSIANTVVGAVKSGAKAIKENADEQARQIEFKILKPFFADTLDENDFLMSKFIRLADRDKRYIESEVCQGSVGFFSEQKGFRYINIFRDSLDVFGLSFYPDSNNDFYYVDPTDRDRYIALDDYFNYLKIMRVNELQMIAKSLGAKHFKVTYMEEQTSFSKKDSKAKIGIKNIANIDGNHSVEEKKYSSVNIAAELNFTGHEPVRPELRYMKKDPSIQALVSMRMDEKDPILNHKFMLKMSNSSGIKESDAIKIDSVIKNMKLSGNASVASEAQNELRRYLEYEIDF